MWRALVGTALFAVAQTAWANEPAGPVDYVRHIKPILSTRCTSCHGALRQQSGLRLDNGALLLKGGEGGPPVEVGKSADSLLMDALLGQNGVSQMPPEGDKLSAEQIDLVRRWIDQGAHIPANEPIPQDPTRYWSFVPPVRTPLPGDAAAHPIDAFLNQALQAKQLTPVGPADRRTLLRRVSLDLIGLPPSPAELRAFIEDEAPDAYERAVDRLLASPHYGERWGRHWMDVWRYSDWDGYGAEVRESQPHMWRWRDWIVESLNADKSYDQMIREMLAGDEIAPTDPQTLRATGFLARNWYLFNRNVWIDNTVEHTGKAFLGLTFNCARCHDHLYDPIRQTEYYSMRAVFEPHNIRIDRVHGEADSKKDGVVRAYDADAAAPTYLFVRGNEADPDKTRALSAGLPEFLFKGAFTPETVSIPPQGFYQGLDETIQKEILTAAEAGLMSAKKQLELATGQLNTARQSLTDYALRVPGESPASQTLLAEDFNSLAADRWESGTGNWKTENGRLIQAEVRGDMCWRELKSPLPADFRATLKFKTTGGQMWKSVGLSFFADGQQVWDAVYLSAYAGGSKLQISHRRAGADAYPANGAKSLPVELNRDYTLALVCHSGVANVFVDGQFQLAYQLPADGPRSGRLRIWTFDALAEFDSFELEALPAQFNLIQPGATQAAAVAAVDGRSELARLVDAVDGQELDERIAAQAVVIGQAELAALQAQIAADRAKYASPSAPDAEALSHAAWRAEQQKLIATAEQARLIAQRNLTIAQRGAAKPAKPVAELEKAVETANKALADAQKALAGKPQAHSSLTTVYPATSTGRRLALANWITRRENPLAARVAINHIWMRHFGAPLVESVFDFGLNGKLPSHPELLDWLAVELMENGWRMKPIHRLIVTSAAYRRESAEAPADCIAADPENNLLWRFSTRRMEAEIVRDSTLACSGVLDRTLGGADLDSALGMTTPRRSLYFRTAKEKQMTFLALFDQASVVECYRRNESIVPQQALAMTNSPLSLSESRRLAGVITAETSVPGDANHDGKFVDALFERVLCRPPHPDERETCLAFLDEQTKLLADPARLSLFTSGAASTVKPASEAPLRARENLAHVLLNHHEFLTIR